MFVDALEGFIERNNVRDLDDHFGQSAMFRATRAWAEFVGSEEAALPGGHMPEAGLAFVVAHAMGQADAFRRAAVALSDPRARGVEHDVIAHLAAGLDVEDALRKASAHPAPADAPQDEGGVVVPFRRPT